MDDYKIFKIRKNEFNSGINILLVDDEEYRHNLVTEVVLGLDDTLKSNCNNLIITNNAEAGLKCFNDFKPDLLIVDIILGDDKDGLEMLQEIRNKYPDVYFKTILFTQHGFEENLIRAIDLRVNAYVSAKGISEEKPGEIYCFKKKLKYDIEDLLKAIIDKEIKEELQKRIRDDFNVASEYEKMTHPAQAKISELPGEYFEIFMPANDKIGGDFHFIHKKDENEFWFMVGDCSGHGTQAAMQKMAAISLTKCLLTNHTYNSPVEFVNELNKCFRISFNINEDNSMPGFEFTLITIDITDDKLIVYKGHKKEKRFLLLNHPETDTFDFSPGNGFYTREFDLSANRSFLIFSDGLIDQFDGNNDKKLTFNGLKEWLLEWNKREEDFKNLKEFITDKFNAWKGTNEMTDDATIIGFSMQ